MQIILVSRHLKVARTVTIMPRHLFATLIAFFALVFSSALFFSWLSVHFRLPVVEDLILSLQQQESKKYQDYVNNNLQLMATRLGELQGQLMQLDNLGQRLGGMAGLKPGQISAAKGGQGGPFIPAPISVDRLGKELESLAAAIDARRDELSVIESRLLEKRVRERLLPTTQPVKDAFYGSPFGPRSDPLAGVRAMHEGIDFNAEIGTPVVAAADGVVLAASFHPEFGNLIEVDHGEGLVSRYAHLSRMEVAAGTLIRRGQKIGAVGLTGRTTGAHLHFEVRVLGVPQNPALFLRQGAEFAELKRR